MSQPIPFSKRKPCRICGRPIVLAYREHITVVATATGERRFLHASCLNTLPSYIQPGHAA